MNHTVLHSARRALQRPSWGPSRTGLLPHGPSGLSSRPSARHCATSDRRENLEPTPVRYNKEIYGPSTSVPREASVVICGGGVVGVAVAHRLAESGITDVVLIEQGSLSCGTTWHAAGLVGALKSGSLDCTLANQAITLYKQLEAEGHGLGVKDCGSISIARTADRMVYNKRIKDFCETAGIQVDLVTPEEIKEKCPLIDVNGALGGAWLPNDIVCSPTDVVNVLAKLAKNKGVEIIERCQLEAVHTKEGTVSGVSTSVGDIQCKYFVNCGGQWARQIGKLSKPNVRVPLHPVEHFYVVTKPMGVDRMMPVIRDYDKHVYMREWSGGILAGGFEEKAKPVFHEKIPDKFEFQLLNEDWDQFHFLLQHILTSMPIMNEAEIRQLLNGPETFTPDGRPLVGESSEVKNYFVAAGMGSQGITFAPGVANLITQWITQGYAESNPWSFDIQRFVSIHNNRKFLRDRVKEVVSTAQRITYPRGQDFTSPRKLRTSSLYSRLFDAQASFGEKCGFERAMYFDSDNWIARLACVSYPRGQDFHDARKLRTAPFHSRLEAASSIFGEKNGCERAMYFDNFAFGPGMFPDGEHFLQKCRKLRTSPLYTRKEERAVFGQILGFERAFWFKSAEDCFPSELSPGTLTFYKPDWFDRVKAEYWACREGVCLIDMSSYTKIELKSAGREVVDYLQYICANDVEQPLGTIIHTGILNQRGGYENDCSVIRMEDNCYFMIAPTSQQTRAITWLRSHLPKDNSVLLSDVTSMYTALNVIGPKAEGLLSELTDTNMTKQEFHTMTCREINLGNASGIKAMRLTHTGEDGFMLYIPSEYALHVYDTLMEKGQDYGIQNAGYYALRALRIEKFFSYWGLDISPKTTPFEVGREFRVKFDKEFIGKEALLKHKERGLRRRLVHFTIEDHDVNQDPWSWGGEPIFRNGVFVGFTTSSCFGYTLNRLVCLGLVNGYDESNPTELRTINPDWLLKNARYEIKVAGKMFPAKAHIYPPQFRSASSSAYIPKVRS